MLLAVSVTTAGCASSAPAPVAALQVPAGCEHYLKVAEIEQAMARPVRAVSSDNGEDCLFRLGTPADNASLALIVDLGSHPADLAGLRQVNLDALPPHGAQIASYYEVADGSETLLALSGEAFYQLIASSEPGAGGVALTGVRPQLVGLAKTVATRL